MADTREYNEYEEYDGLYDKEDILITLFNANDEEDLEMLMEENL